MLQHTRRSGEPAPLSHLPLTGHDRRVALRVVEIGGHADDRLGDAHAITAAAAALATGRRRLGVGEQLREHERADLFGVDVARGGALAAQRDGAVLVGQHLR